MSFWSVLLAPRRLPKTAFRWLKKLNWKVIGKLGAQMVKEVASKNLRCGRRWHDNGNRGRSKHRQCGHEICRSRHESDGFKRGIDKAVVSSVAHLKSISKDCRTRTESPKSHLIGKFRCCRREIIAEAMDKVGKEGVITVEDGTTLENELEVVEGHAV